MNTTGIILAGGKSKRFGRAKAIVEIDGTPIIEHVYRRLIKVTDKIIIAVSTADIEIPSNIDAAIVKDKHPGAGPLGGIYTGLAASNSTTNIVVACDMPFLNCSLLEYMLSVSGSYDAVIPQPGHNLFEPLHAVYTKSCLPLITRQLENEEYAISGLLRKIKVRYLEPDEIARFDPDSTSFFNINFEIDLETANRWIAPKQPGQ